MAVPTAEPGALALSLLRRPFTPEAVKFKVQAFKNGKGIVVCYIDARLVIERLNQVCGFNWYDEYEAVPGGMICHLTVYKTTRSDVGEPGSSPQGMTPKAIISDALKRAAVKFGVGVSLYAVPKMRISSSDVWMIGEKVGGLTDEAERRIRSGYGVWLKKNVDLFGEAIDHGDSFDSVGDYETVDVETGEATKVEQVAIPEPVAGRSPTAPPSTAVVSDAQIRKIWASAKDHKIDEAELHELLEIVAKVDSIKLLPKAKVDVLLEKMPAFRVWKDSKMMDAPPSVVDDAELDFDHSAGEGYR